MTDKPAEIHKKRLKSRTIRALSKAVVATPSEKKSIAAKKREMRRAGLYRESCANAARDLMSDCHTCKRKPCKTFIQVCGEPSILERCQTCGQPYLHYVDANIKWVRCTDCTIRKGVVL